MSVPLHKGRGAAVAVGLSKGGVAGVLAEGRVSLAARLAALRPGAALAGAVEREWDERRFFLWLPVAAGAGVFLYLAADREPVLWLPLALAAAAAVAAVLLRDRPRAFAPAVAALALALGFVSAELRAWRVASPMLERVRIAKLTGFVEELDARPNGARFILRVADAADIGPDQRPTRVRLTTKRADGLEAGRFVALTARLVPPSAAALPGGYDFSRDAFFAGIGAVGTALGRIVPAEAPVAPPLGSRVLMAVDRGRNALAARVNTVVGGGDVGAVAAAMVTGKRDLLSQDGRDVIRQAGIFHIVTIAGVQMTLVAAILFGTLRRMLALSPTLALRHPIKKWAALAAIAGAVVYDIGTGSRIGTQRALFMTAIMLGATLADRRGLTMRNLALAALLVVAVEPEAIAGASFQLSFAAVSALIAVQEARRRRPEGAFAEPAAPAPPRASRLWRGAGQVREKLVALGLATIGATLATASFMAAAFHELSPYVFIGNPLTLAVIEAFAVPGALLGTVLYPLGLDAPVWHWVAFGIRFVFWFARHLAETPGATIFVRGFAPWSLPCLAMALFSVVIWRTALLRATAVPWLLLGLCGASLGPRFDMVVAPDGSALAVRDDAGALGVVGRSNAFTIEQWLRADGDGREVAGRDPATFLAKGARCDRLACVAPAPGGQMLSVVADADAFEEDCRRADIIVTPLFAPESCAAELIIDRGSLEATGALGLVRRDGAWLVETARREGGDRPWSRAPKARAFQARAPVRPGTDPRRTGQGEADLAKGPDEAEPVRLP